jgi:O-antigen/teichoic acid export membrane protein
MSLEKQILKSVSWMAFFNFFTQCFSWIITIVIARLLLPSDYGLMAMATIITGYALNLSELGLGNAIIQRFEINENEISSVFWFLMGITLLLALSCFPVSYITAHIMHELKVIPITKTVALVFLLNGLQIIPSSLLRKEMKFKSVGSIEMIATTLSCVFMFMMAKAGYGVWTLINGYIIRSLIKTVLLFYITKWRPRLHYNFSEARKYLSFGIIQATGNSLFYIQESSDRFFAGRVWQSTYTGLYSFAKSIADIPTNKIVSLINNVSFPAFSKVQNNEKAFTSLYLNISKVTSLIVIPLFVSGFILGKEIITLTLNPKWYPMITIFKLLCLAEIFTGMNAINNFVHAARGKPKMALYYNLACSVGMPLSFYFAVPYGLNAIAVPWLSTYVILSLSWIVISLHQLDISVMKYIKYLSSALYGTALLVVVLILLRIPYSSNIIHGSILKNIYLIATILIGIISYSCFLWVKEKDFIMNIKQLIKK